VTIVDPRPASGNVRRLNGLRANSLAVVVMLLIEFGLGISANLYATLPQSDHGKGMLPAFGGAVTGGPVVLALHALLGTFLLAGGIAAFVRAILIRRPALLGLTGVALLSIVVAWMSGSQFVGTMDNGASLAMALATAVSILCYVLILFLVAQTAESPDDGSPDRPA
jgi:hypothetical protein